MNEIAPRPHNSGHYSIEACDYSQFDTHILAVTGQSLPNSIELLKPAVMMNLLGKDLDLLKMNLMNIQSGTYIFMVSLSVKITENGSYDCTNE